MLSSFPDTQKSDIFIGKISSDFVPCNTAIISYPLDDRYFLLNVRTVNYMINDRGRYKTNNDKKILITENYFYFLDKDTFEPVKESWSKIRYDHIPDKRINPKFKGVEDIRLVLKNDEVWFYGSTNEYSYTDKTRIIYGRYDIKNKALTDTVVLHPPMETELPEKNWTFIEKDTFIYRWYPLEIYRLKGQKTEKLFSYRTPSLFKKMRGSSPACLWRGFFWTIAHMKYMPFGNYIHFLIALHPSDYRIIGVSSPFVFEGTRIEYCLGMEIHKDHFVLLYSTQDKTSKYIRVPAFILVQTCTWYENPFKLLCL